MYLARKMFVCEGKGVESTVCSAMIVLLIRMVLKSIRIAYTYQKQGVAMAAISHSKPQPKPKPLGSKPKPKPWR